MKKQRNHSTPEDKVAILRRRLLKQVPISQLCDKKGLQPTVFQRGQKEFFENGAAAFQPKARTTIPHSRTDMPEMGMNALQQRQIRRHSAARKSHGATLRAVPRDG